MTDNVEYALPHIIMSYHSRRASFKRVHALYLAYVYCIVFSQMHLPFQLPMQCLLLYVLRLILSIAVDHSRVVLSVPDESGSDYINASYIDVSDHCSTLSTGLLFSAISLSLLLSRATCRRMLTSLLKVTIAHLNVYYNHAALLRSCKHVGPM